MSGPETYRILGALFKKKKTKLRIKIRHETEYLFRIGKEITRKYKFKNADK